jgi:lipopolysaccharide transport system ATP-binding protein
MNDIVITAENIGKRYRIGGRQPYKALRDTLANAAKAPWGLVRDWLNPHSALHAPKQEDFWALRDVSFEIKRGEVVGLIGRNGAGKSTLLKILSRITEPTTGRIELDGRVGSLLEVGTGFHPELTGRENIFLNGAILGMKRREILAKFDEIVEFAEIAKFIDTPVKHYSSGMYMRLAFSVAAHLEPEILLVDEVLAVGDAAFQKKCLGKMGEVAHQGRTVVFVSHNMGIISHLCSHAILLGQGQVQEEGSPRHVIGCYFSTRPQHINACSWGPAERPGSERIQFSSCWLADENGNGPDVFDLAQPIKLFLEYEIMKPIAGLRVGFRLATIDGTIVFTTSDSILLRERGDPSRQPGKFRTECVIPANFLNEGTYRIFNIWADEPGIRVDACVEPELTFQTGSFTGLSAKLPIDQNWEGTVQPLLSWSLTQL